MLVHPCAKANPFRVAVGIVIRTADDGKARSTLVKTCLIVSEAQGIPDPCWSLSRASTTQRLPNDEVNSNDPALGLPFGSLRVSDWILTADRVVIAGFKSPRGATNRKRRCCLPFMRTPSHIQDTAPPTREGHTHTPRTARASCACAGDGGCGMATKRGRRRRVQQRLP